MKTQKIFICSIVMNTFLNDSRVLKEALSLKKENYAVQVIALNDEKGSLPSFEIVQGLEVRRVYLSSKKWAKNFFVQIIKYIEFMIKASYICYKVDIIHCNDLGPLPVAVWIKILRMGRSKIVYDAHELETEQFASINQYKYKMLVMLEKFLVKFIDKMITVSDGIADEYVKRYAVSPPTVIMNAPIYAEIKRENLFRHKFGILPQQKILLYQGGLMEGRGIGLLIEAFKKNENKNVVLVIMGYGSLEKKIRKDILGANNIYFHPAVSPDILRNFTISADFGVCITENVCLSNYYSLPNKLFECAMVGLPVLLSDLYEFQKMNQKYHIGVILSEYTVSCCIEMINKLVNEEYDKLSFNAKKMAKENSWQIQEKKLLALYREIL